MIVILAAVLLSLMSESYRKVIELVKKEADGATDRRSHLVLTSRSVAASGVQ